MLNNALQFGSNIYRLFCSVEFMNLQSCADQFPGKAGYGKDIDP